MTFSVEDAMTLLSQQVNHPDTRVEINTISDSRGLGGPMKIRFVANFTVPESVIMKATRIKGVAPEMTYKQGLRILLNRALEEVNKNEARHA